MISLQEHLEMAECDEHLKQLILLISRQAIHIKKGFFKKFEYTGTVNIYGDRQIELDKWADEVLISALRNSGLVSTIASEEQSDIIEIVTPTRGFGVTLDPLDGSSLVEVNLTVGTIAGIYKDANVLQKGKNMCAAIYVLYGPLTVFVYTIKRGVHEFVLGEDGEFILQRENIVMPEGKIYSPGGLKRDHTEKHIEFLNLLESSGHKLRYSGCFVADFHQILTYGGIFSYPALRGRQSGKLRLLFEANPIGFIAREAGGEISTGTEDILEIAPQSLDQRVPLYVGSKSKIKELERIMKEEK